MATEFTPYELAALAHELRLLASALDTLAFAGGPDNVYGYADDSTTVELARLFGIRNGRH